MARRDGGEGSVSYSKHHKYWEGQVPPRLRGNGFAMSVRAATKSECKAKLTARIAEIEAAIARKVVTPHGYTVRMCIETWLAWSLAEAKFGKSRHDAYKGQAEKWIYSEYGDLPLGEFTAKKMRECLKAAAPELGPVSLAAILSVMRRSINLAMAGTDDTDPMIDHNDARIVDMPRAGRERKGRRSIDKDDVERLLDDNAGYPVLAALGLGCLGGLRPTEIRVLGWDDVDLEAGEVSVTKWIKHGTTESRRTIGMPRKLIRILKEHKKIQDAQREHAGEMWQENGLVVCHPDGRPHTADTLRYYIDKAYAKSCIFSTTEVYIMRHTYATALFKSKKVELRDISESMGHAHEGVTRTVYIDLVNPRTTRAAKVMDDIYDDEDLRIAS